MHRYKVMAVATLRSISRFGISCLRVDLQIQHTIQTTSVIAVGALVFTRSTYQRGGANRTHDRVLQSIGCNKGPSTSPLRDVSHSALVRFQTTKHSARGCYRVGETGKVSKAILTSLCTTSAAKAPMVWQNRYSIGTSNIRTGRLHLRFQVP